MQIEEVRSEQVEEKSRFEFVALPENEKYFPNFLAKVTHDRFFKW